MGSGGKTYVGVSTGRLTGNQIGQLLSAPNGAGGRVGTVSVGGKVPDRIFVDNENGRGGFTINMTGVPQSVRNAYLRALRGRTNTDNSQRAYDRAYKAAIAAGRSEAEAVRLAQNARTQVASNVARSVANSKRFKSAGIRVTGRRVRK